MQTVRRAGDAALVGVVTLILSAIALILFFAGAGAFWGPVNDVLIAFTLLLIIPAILIVRRRARGRVGAWFGLLSLIAVIGLVEAAAGQLLLVARVITLGDSFVTGGIGFAPLLVWMVALAVLALRIRLVATSVGWWVVAFITVWVLLFAALPFVPMTTLAFVAAGPWFLAFAGWLLALGLDLRRRADADPSPLARAGR